MGARFRDWWRYWRETVPDPASTTEFVRVIAAVAKMDPQAQRTIARRIRWRFGKPKVP